MLSQIILLSLETRFGVNLMLDGDTQMLYPAQEGAFGGYVFGIEELDGSGTAYARSSRQ